MFNHNLKLFGYKNIFNQLVKLDNNNKLPSRILLTGQEGIGKTTFSLHFINYLLSKNEECTYNLDENKIYTNNSSFNLVKNLSHPNFYCVFRNNEKKNIDIEQIRNMNNFLNKSSFNNERKIILIDDIELLNINSSNALLKNLEESNSQNLFILTHNINKSILDTIKSRCLTFKLYFTYNEIKNVISTYFDENVYEELNDEFKSFIVSPKFLINHINFVYENKLDLNSLDSAKSIKYIIDNKSYKKNPLILDNFQCYVEIYFSKLFKKTKDYKYYDYFFKSISDNDLLYKFNLDLDSFFIKFYNKYLNI